MKVTTTIRQWGESLAVRIPKAMADRCGLRVGAKIKILAVPEGLKFVPVRRRKTYRLSDLLARCKGKNPDREAIRE